MKRISTILTFLMLFCMGTWADDWTPSIPTGSLISVGEKVASITAASSAEDNSHWYLITQVRNGESAIYDNGTQAMRGATSATANSFNGTSAQTNAAYLVRFINSDGVYKIQFGTGRFISGKNGNNKLTTGNTAETFLFYNSNSGSGSYFGWNQSSDGTTYGSIVDNDGAGATVGFYGSGQVSGTSGNNVWYVYSVEVGLPLLPPSLPSGKLIRLGSAVTSITAVTEADDNDHWYMITQTRDGESPMYDVAVGSTLKRAAASVTPASLNGVNLSENTKYIVRFVGNSTDGYNVQFANGHVITSDLKTHFLESHKGTFDIKYNGTTGFGWSRKGGAGDNIVDNNGAGNALSIWGQGEGGNTDNNTWTIYSITFESPISITYNVKMGGNTVATTSVNQLSETAASLPTSLQNNYCDYGDPDVSTVSSVNNVVNYNATLKDGFPFEYSTDYENATWYYWKLNGNYASYTADDTACPISTTKPTTDNGLWAFIGTPYGTKIINKAAGDGKYMQNTGSNPKMTSTETSWIVARNSNKDIEYFTVHSGANNYMNARGGNIAYWNSSAGATDNGSTFTVETYSLEYATDVATYISPYFDTHGEYFSLKDAVYTANSSTWTAAKETCDKTTYDALYAIVTNTDNIVYPETGYYLLKNNNTGTYLNTTASVGLSATDDAPSSIVRLTKNNDGTYYIESQGLYVHTAGSQANVVRNASALAYTPVIGTGGKVAFYDGKNNGVYGYLSASGSNVINFPARGISTDPQSYWIVEDAPASITLPLTAIGGNTYATTYLPFDATVSGSDVTANAVVVADVHVGYVVPTALDKIPAGTPVILRGANTSATSATLNINTGDAFSAISGTSALEGVYVNTDFSLSETDDESNSCTADYFLGMLDSALGFYRSGIESKTGYYTLGANRAYLPADVVAAAGARGFSIMWNDDEVTGIRTIDNGKQSVKNGAFYDLSGRRVENPQHGMYIVNGRVVVIK